MVELFEQYWEVILGISANLLVILKMLGTLKNRVETTANDSKKLFIKLINEISELKEDNLKKDKLFDTLLTYVENEASLKQLNKIIPDENKEAFNKLKEEALKLHSEIKGD